MTKLYIYVNQQCVNFQQAYCIMLCRCWHLTAVRQFLAICNNHRLIYNDDNEQWMNVIVIQTLQAWCRCRRRWPDDCRRHTGSACPDSTHDSTDLRPYRETVISRQTRFDICVLPGHEKAAAFSFLWPVGKIASKNYTIDLIFPPVCKPTLPLPLCPHLKQTFNFFSWSGVCWICPRL